MVQARSTLLVSSALATLVMAAPAAAQQAQDNEIIVTANQRAQSVQDVPIAINVLTEEQLRAAGATDIGSALQDVAGVEFRTEQTGTGAIAIRGIAELNTSNINGTTGTAVGLYIDDAPFSVGGFFPQAAVFDAARLEVLRGPQGTIFGEGSLAGTIRVVTNKPDAGKVAGAIEGNVGAVKRGGTNGSVNGMVNLPIVKDKVALRVVGFWQQDAGWIDRTAATVTAQFLPQPNPILGPAAPDVKTIWTRSTTTPDANGADSWGGRAALAITPNDSFKATASVLLSRADRGYPNRGGRDGTGYFSSGKVRMTDDFEMYSLVLEQKADFGTFLSSSNYFKRRIDQTTDQFGIIALANQIGVPLSGGQFVFQGSRTDNTLRVKEFNQELRFVSAFKGPFQLTAGGFYRNRDVGFRIRGPQEPLTPAGIANVLCGGLCGYTLPGSGDLDARTTSNSRQIAAFAEGTFDITPKFQLLAGARYFNDKRKSSTLATSLFSGLPFPQTFGSKGEDNVFNPRVSLRWQPNSDVSAYISFSRGFRSGGQNDLFVLVAGATPADQTFKSERLSAYEAGVKTQFGTGGRFNAAVFYNDWSNLQVVTKEGTGGVGEVIGNAGSARSYGVDLDASYEVSKGLVLAANTTIISSKLKDVIASGALIKEARIPGTANFTASGSINYNFPVTDKIEGFARASVTHRGNALSGLLRIGTPVEQIPAYTTLDLRAGATIGSARFEVYAENVTNAFVPLSIFYAPNASNPGGGDPLTGNVLYYQGSPRVIGARVSFRY
jgi:iron complex outermembrane receptor protein